MAFVYGGRCAVSQRRGLEGGVNALLVHGVAGFVHRAEDAAERVLEDARGDAHVADGELGTEGMVRQVLAAAVEVVAVAAHDVFAEVQLRGRFKVTPLGDVGDLRLPAQLRNKGAEPGAQLAEDGANRVHGHAVVGARDQRVGDMGGVREEIGVAAAEVERFLQVRGDRREVILRASRGPHDIGIGRVRRKVGHELAGNAGGAVVIAAHHAQQTGVVVVIGAGVDAGLHGVEQATDGRIRQASVRQRAQRGGFGGARRRAAGRHIGGLVPIKHGGGSGEVVDFVQARQQFAAR